MKSPGALQTRRHVYRRSRSRYRVVNMVKTLYDVARMLSVSSSTCDEQLYVWLSTCSMEERDALVRIARDCKRYQRHTESTTAAAADTPPSHTCPYCTELAACLMDGGHMPRVFQCAARRQLIGGERQDDVQTLPWVTDRLITASSAGVDTSPPRLGCHSGGGDNGQLTLLSYSASSAVDVSAATDVWDVFVLTHLSTLLPEKQLLRVLARVSHMSPVEHRLASLPPLGVVDDTQGVLQPSYCGWRVHISMGGGGDAVLVTGCDGQKIAPRRHSRVLVPFTRLVPRSISFSGEFILMAARHGTRELCHIQYAMCTDTAPYHYVTAIIVDIHTLNQHSVPTDAVSRHQACRRLVATGNVAHLLRMPHTDRRDVMHEGYVRMITLGPARPTWDGCVLRSWHDAGGSAAKLIKETFRETVVHTLADNGSSRYTLCSDDDLSQPAPKHDAVHVWSMGHSVRKRQLNVCIIAPADDEQQQRNVVDIHTRDPDSGLVELRARMSYAAATAAGGMKWHRQWRLRRGMCAVYMVELQAADKGVVCVTDVLWRPDMCLSNCCTHTQWDRLVHMLRTTGYTL